MKNILEMMQADADRCNERLKETGAIRSTKKKKEKKEKEPRATRGEGWRNKPLTKEEISDIEYFTEKGWCVTSIAMSLGLSNSTVRNYQKRYTK
jgi:DNA-binding NarL/FixJ family response regulator